MGLETAERHHTGLRVKTLVPIKFYAFQEIEIETRPDGNGRRKSATTTPCVESCARQRDNDNDPHDDYCAKANRSSNRCDSRAFRGAYLSLWIRAR